MKHRLETANIDYRHECLPTKYHDAYCREDIG